jgi:hypothetical protein
MRSPGTRFVILAFVLVIITSLSVSASGPVGMFAVIEKVIFEPNDQSPERIQLWGAFAFVAGGVRGEFTAPPQRGYLYFSMAPSNSQSQRETTRKEWADFNAVAGTGQGVAFGDWFYVGAFLGPGDQPDAYDNVGNKLQPIQVSNNAAVKPTPIPYVLNTGVVKLSGTGSQGAMVEQLRALLKK